MRYQQGQMTEQRSIIEAIETLSSIAELELDSPIAVAEKHEVSVQNIPISYRSVHWLHKQNATKVMGVVKDTFRVILGYLRKFYKREVGHLSQHESVEGIKTIMSLVGEAAKKLDKFSELLNQGPNSSVKETREFRELLTFYKRKIAPIAEQESLVKWMKMLPIRAVLESTKKPGFVKDEAFQHVFIDLDTVKNDLDYELFLIRKEDGTRFFNPRLLRNVKLVSNFEEYFSEEDKVDVYKDLRTWQNSQARVVSKNIVRKTWMEINDFIKDAKHFLDSEPAMILYRSILALLLATQEAPQKTTLAKGSSAYFSDFQKFMRALVASHIYQEIITYPQRNHSSMHFKVCHLVQEFIRALFDGQNIPKDLVVFVDGLIEQGKEGMEMNEVEHHLEKPILSYNLALEYEALTKGAKPYSHTPLARVLDALQDPDIRGYDPLLLQNIPSHLFTLDYPHHHLSVIRMATPTQQDYINKAFVNEEFKGFIRSLSKDKPARMHLLFNLQDRTSWREFARSRVLEELQKKEEFAKHLYVVTQTKDSDFYNQAGPYLDLNQVDVFIEHLLEHSASENSGYYYPPKVQQALFKKFAPALAKKIHELFFASKNVLSRSARMDFIELFYLFMQLKMIEIVSPTSVSFTCKDAIDIGMPASCELFYLLKLINDRPLSHEEEAYMKVLLFGVPLITRGRNLFSDRFTRMNSMIKVVEAAIEDQGMKEFMQKFSEKIAPLFDSKILSATLKI